MTLFASRAARSRACGKDVSQAGHEVSEQADEHKQPSPKVAYSGIKGPIAMNKARFRRQDAEGT